MYHKIAGDLIRAFQRVHFYIEGHIDEMREKLFITFSNYY